MATPAQPHQRLSSAPNPLKRPLVKLFLTTIPLSLSYFLGSYTNSFYSLTFLQQPHQYHHPFPCLQLNFTTHVPISTPLHFEPRHTLPLPQQPPPQKLLLFQLCPRNFTNYLPCHDPSIEKNFTGQRFFHRDRHCPDAKERVKCLIPKPIGYQRPFRWPKSKDYAWFRNVPSKKLTLYKKSQNWVRLEGDRLVFPGGGTSFPRGAKGYVDLIKRIVPLKSGKIRKVLDVGCGVASFGASLMDYNILTMSVAPRDVHEAQVQFALERGLPAMLGILCMSQLPYPSRSFDMAHCSRCLFPWTSYGSLA